MLKRFEEGLSPFVTEGDILLVAVSGGADSTAMLSLLYQCQQKLGFQIEVVHFHHHLRLASDQEWHDVEALCERWKLPFIGRHLYVREQSEAFGGNLEATAHQMRHQALEQLADERQARWILLAHHANDRAETLLMNILRGTSTAGLAAMPRQQNRLLRPMIDFTRQEIEQYCLEQGLAFAHDESNDDVTITRNRIRHQLMPTLQTYNREAVRALIQLGKSAEREQDFMNHEMMALFQAACFHQGKAWMLLEKHTVEAAHDALQARLIQYSAQNLTNTRYSVRFDMIAQCLKLVQKGQGQYQLGQGILFEVTRQWIYVGKLAYGSWERTSEGWYHPFLELQVKTSLPDIALKGYEAGDQLAIKGLGKKSVKKIFQEQALPICLRNIWPIVYDEKLKNIICIPLLATGTNLMYYKGEFVKNAQLEVLLRERQLH